ncbi:MAG: hypothetical protein RIR01_2298 [Bacteroidota bacterium]|jgi:hypothetical protein
MQIEPFKVICIDDTKIPNEIPKHLRVVEKKIYTAEGIVHLLSSNVIGLHILECPLTEKTTFPYLYWGAHRFIPYTEEAMAELMSLEKEIGDMLTPDKTRMA